MLYINQLNPEDKHACIFTNYKGKTIKVYTSLNVNELTQEAIGIAKVYGDKKPQLSSNTRVLVFSHSRKEKRSMFLPAKKLYNTAEAARIARKALNNYTRQKKQTEKTLSSLSDKDLEYLLAKAIIEYQSTQNNIVNPQAYNLAKMITQ